MPSLLDVCPIVMPCLRSPVPAASRHRGGEAVPAPLPRPSWLARMAPRAAVAAPARTMRRGLAAAATLVAATSMASLAAAAPGTASAAPAMTAETVQAPAMAQGGQHERIRFEEIGARAGARIPHHARAFAGKGGAVLSLFPGGGAAVAIGDYDNDGYDDVFVTETGNNLPNHLLHNNGPGKDGSITFTDMTAVAGVAGGNDPHAAVTGALWFDYDNDGRIDLLVIRLGTPILYHNEGNGRFRDVTAASGLDRKPANTVAAIAFDFDNDGHLDLLFGNYQKAVDLFDLKDPHVLPNSIDHADNGGGVTLWRNQGNGTFVEVTEKAGLGRITGWILAVGHADLDNDGWQDLYLAGDFGPDFLFLNNHDGTFRDVTAGAIGHDGKHGMNVDVADYDHDGWLDVYVTNITDDFMQEGNMLWHNNGLDAGGRLSFTDVARETGTSTTLWGWAAKFADFDNDGWEDLMVANGMHTAADANYVPVLGKALMQPGGFDFSDLDAWPAIGDMTWSGHQRKKLFRNAGNGTFQEIGALAGVDNDLDGRGLGVADFDNDGLLDFVQTNREQPSLLYHNRTAGAGNWIELKLAGVKSNRDAIGARVTLRAGGLRLIREVNGGNGFESQSSTRLHFGLGAAARIDEIEIRWPSGLVEKLAPAAVPINRIYRVEEGKGVVGLLPSRTGPK
ncbi:MAG TPA: CRTAC1 family protein [Thermoanaerobaculia bacterium]|nr:CRTAC1 family protein [Thermoanaerobaculia bacterium]